MNRFCHGRLLPLIFGALVALVSATSFGREPEGRIITRAAEVQHVFIIMLENKNYTDTFGASAQDPYLQKTLVPMGALLTQYYGTGHVSLDNYISLISGQPATPATISDCITPNTYSDVQQTGTTPDGLVIAPGGCIYGPRIKTLVNQLEERGLSWKGYMEDMGNDPTRESATCGHPALGTLDNATSFEKPSAAVPNGDGYATRHDPFMYFHAVIDSQASCAAHVVNLSKLTADLEQERTTPNLSFITPNLCNDGHDGDGSGTPGFGCANGQPGGLTSVDAFLQTWVPKILASPAYRKDGLLIITFDEGTYTTTVSTDPTTGVTSYDSTFPGQTCCDQQPGPNLAGVRPLTQTTVVPGFGIFNLVYAGYGGDRVGAVLLSPFIKPGSTSETAYNHYSMLRSLEDIFQVGGYLGYAADNPRTGYWLDTIGNDREIFEHDYDPAFENRHDFENEHPQWFKRFGL